MHVHDLCCSPITLNFNAIAVNCYLSKCMALHCKPLQLLAAATALSNAGCQIAAAGHKFCINGYNRVRSLCTVYILAMSNGVDYFQIRHHHIVLSTKLGTEKFRSSTKTSGGECIQLSSPLFACSSNFSFFSQMHIWRHSVWSICAVYAMASTQNIISADRILKINKNIETYLLTFSCSSHHLICYALFDLNPKANAQLRHPTTSCVK